MKLNLRVMTACVLMSVGALASCALNPFSGDDDEGEAPPEAERQTFMTFEQGLEVDPELADTDINLPASAPNRFWRMEGGTPNHVLAHPDLAEFPDRIWRRNVGQGSNSDLRITAPPVIEDGRIFALDARGAITALDAEDGRRLWRESIRSDERRDRTARVGGLAVTEGKIFVTAGFGVVAALNAETGDEIWRTSVAAPMHAPPTVAGGRVFAISVDNELFALDADDGTILWSYQSLSEPARILTASTPAVSGDVVVAPFASGELVALRADNGVVLWSEGLTRRVRTTPLSALNDIAGSPVIVGDVVYAVSHSGLLAAMDLRTGEPIWTQPASGIHRPWIVGGFVFLVTTEAELVCMSRFNGRIFWISQLTLYENERRRRGKISWGGPVLAGGKLYLVSSEGRMVSFDVDNGEKLDSYRLGGPTFIPPVVANRTLYVLNDDAELAAYR